MSSESRAAWVRIGRLLAGHAADSLRRALARSNAPCIRTQCPASLQPRRSRASASRGETPARPLTTRDNVFRVTPSRTAASETVQPSASMASRMISPGCAGAYICFVQCGQDPSDSRRQIWIDSPSVAAVVESLQSAMSELHRPTVACNAHVARWRVPRTRRARRSLLVEVRRDRGRRPAAGAVPPAPATPPAGPSAFGPLHRTVPGQPPPADGVAASTGTPSRSAGPSACRPKTAWTRCR